MDGMFALASQEYTRFAAPVSDAMGLIVRHPRIS